VARSSGILPSDCANVLRRFADSTSVCWQRTGAHRARHPAGFSLHTLAAPQGAPFRRHPAAAATAFARLRFAARHMICPTQCRDARIRGLTRRSRCRASQALRRKARRGAARDRRACAAVHGCTVCATPQRREAQGSSIRTMRIEPPWWALDLFGYFLGHCAAGAARTAELAAKRRRAGCPESCQKV